MSLKQSIVVVSEYSIKQPGGSGSRGATPGSYVQRYMARESATETVAPIQRRRTDDFIQRYMARESAVERVGSTSTMVRGEMRQAQGEGGVAFGYGSVSLSDEQLRAASRDIQSWFDAGHTVLKTVLSFDEEYLKTRGLVDEDFELTRAGDYRGHLDQMKLRMAIMHGLGRMGGDFDDLRYVGVIQVDTEHVHCHLAMTDAGRGQVTRDGTQRGKLLDRHKSRLRRGTDAWLDEKQAVAHLSSAVGYERRNVTSYIKRWAHRRIASESLPQLLLATLPEDRSLWRAGSNDVRMRKASRLVEELVTEQLERSDSPMPAAMEKIHRYAGRRREDEGLSTRDWQDLIERGRGQIVHRAVNSVYQVLRSLPESELTVRTPMLHVMGMDHEHLATLAAERSDHQNEDLVSFGFRLRSTATRLKHHKEQAGVWRDLARQWERAEKADVVGQHSKPLHDFYLFEEEYHRMLVSKYQHFLPVMADADQWWIQQQEVTDYGQRLMALTAMRHDASLQRMKDPEAAERVGREVYDQPGGRHLTSGSSGRSVLDQRIVTMREVYEAKVVDLREDLALSGLILRTSSDERNETDQLERVSIEPGVAHDFEQVKALDLHHMTYDFPHDVPVGRRAGGIFREAATDRRALLFSAMSYLDSTGQSAAIEDLPVDDVAAMTRMVEKIRDPADGGDFVLPSRIADLRSQQEQEDLDLRRSASSSLDAGLVEVFRARVDEVVSSSPQIEVDADPSHQPTST